MHSTKLEIKDKIKTEINAILISKDYNENKIYETKMQDALKALNTVIFDYTFAYMVGRFSEKMIKRISVRDWINHLYYFYNGLDQNNESTDYVR